MADKNDWQKHSTLQCPINPLFEGKVINTGFGGFRGSLMPGDDVGLNYVWHLGPTNSVTACNELKESIRTTQPNVPIGYYFRSCQAGPNNDDGGYPFGLPDTIPDNWCLYKEDGTKQMFGSQGNYYLDIRKSNVREFIAITATTLAKKYGFDAVNYDNGLYENIAGPNFPMTPEEINESFSQLLIVTKELCDKAGIKLGFNFASTSGKVGAGTEFYAPYCDVLCAEMAFHTQTFEYPSMIAVDVECWRRVLEQGKRIILFVQKGVDTVDMYSRWKQAIILCRPLMLEFGNLHVGMPSPPTDYWTDPLKLIDVVKCIEGTAI